MVHFGVVNQFRIQLYQPAPRSGDNRNSDKLENKSIKMTFHTSSYYCVFMAQIIRLAINALAIRFGINIHKTTFIFNGINNADKN